MPFNSTTIYRRPVCYKLYRKTQLFQLVFTPIKHYSTTKLIFYTSNAKKSHFFEDWEWDLPRKSPYSVRIRENTDHKKLRIWTLFTQWNKEHDHDDISIRTLPHGSSAVVKPSSLISRNRLIQENFSCNWKKSNGAGS